MMSNWSIQLNPANEKQLNDVLLLNQSKHEGHFRSWFGTLAGEIYHALKSGFKFPLARPHTLDKTQAQHILIQAGLVQQQCMYHYRVYHDLKTHEINDLATHELLLFIRMANYHPSLEDLHNYQHHSHVIESLDHLQTLVNNLLHKKLIQCIIADSQQFYDKNPYPHCHLFDTQTGRISDYDCYLQETQKHRFVRIEHHHRKAAEQLDPPSRLVSGANQR